MAITIDDFSKIWASTSPLTPYSFSDDNYKNGWNFIGGTPPSRQMWDFLQKNNDEKMQYLANNYLPLSGGTMTGAGEIKWSADSKNPNIMNADNSFLFGYGHGSYAGALIALRSADNTGETGAFELYARANNQGVKLTGKPDGTLEWNGKEVERVNASGTNYIRYENGLQICWENLGSVANGTQRDWTLPVAFKDTTYFLAGVCGQYGFSAVSTITCARYSTTVAHFKQYNTSNAGMGLWGIAIGYWK